MLVATKSCAVQSTPLTNPEDLPVRILARWRFPREWEFWNVAGMVRAQVSQVQSAGGQQSCAEVGDIVGGIVEGYFDGMRFVAMEGGFCGDGGSCGCLIVWVDA